jgi:dienelactone hydrolase
MILHRVLAAAALAAAFVLASAPAQADLKKGWLDYTHGSMKLKGYLVHDDKIAGKRPAILMLHARDGMTEKNQKLADNWAKFGYVVLVADIFGYGQGILPKGVPEMSAQTAIYTKDVPLMRARTGAGYDALVKHPVVDAGKIATIGYCFGGAVGAEFATTGAPLSLSVSIHGSFRGHQPGWAKTVKGRYLILHGSEDKGYPIATITGVVNELRAANVPFQLELYSGTGHGFSAPKNKDEERADKQSIAATGRALKEVFGL